MIRFLENELTEYPFASIIEKRYEDDQAFWWPLMMGIATKEEVQRANVKELQFLNLIATKKWELTYKLGGSNFGE